MVRLGKWFYVCAFAAIVLTLVQIGSGRATTLSATTVVSNPNFETLAVDPSGTAWGTPTANKTQLWKSSDEGANWTQVTGWSSIGKQPWYITPLQSGALLVAYSTGTNWAVARSGDGGATWTTVLLLPCMNDACTLRYTTLTQHSITQGDGYVFLGTYNNNSAMVNTNYVYRSADDGRTWSVVNTPTTFRHIHGLTFDPSRHRLYVFAGDSTGDGLWYSNDDGATLQPLCTDYRCIGIEAAAAGDSIVFGTDNPGVANHIVRVDAQTGAYADVATTTYPSYSAGRTGNILLVGETHENGAAIVTPQIHLYASDNGGASWQPIWGFTIPSSSDYEIHVESVYPNGDVAVDVSGQGTVVLRIGSLPGGAPANTAAPTISGSTQQGQALTASTGSWTNSPTTFAYQWSRCNSSGSGCSDITTALGSSYTLQAADVGSTLRVNVNATNGSGTSSVTSAATAVVTGTGATSPPSNTALPMIAGAAQAGQTLLASPGSWSNGPTSITYQWRKCSSSGASCADIGSETAATYTVRTGDVGSTLRVRVTASNSAGGASADSLPTQVVTAASGGGGGGGGGGTKVAAPTSVSAPLISGVPRRQQTLTASTGTWTGSPSAFGYQWSRCNASGSACTAIVGGTASTLALGQADVGSTLRVTVSATNLGGTSSAMSSATPLVGELVPAIVARPRIHGTLRVGQTLSTGGGSWSTLPERKQYSWLRCRPLGGHCAVITGATAPRYTIHRADAGHALRVAVTASTTGGSARAVSPATGVVRR